MSADFKFKGPFQTELAAYISEKRRLGCKYVAEEEWIYVNTLDTKS